MVGESFHPSGCWGEDSDHTRLGATVQKLSRLFAIRVADLLAAISGAALKSQPKTASFFPPRRVDFHSLRPGGGKNPENL
jgi:hypothetical protein